MTTPTKTLVGPIQIPTSLTEHSGTYQEKTYVRITSLMKKHNEIYDNIYAVEGYINKHKITIINKLDELPKNFFINRKNPSK